MRPVSSSIASLESENNETVGGIIMEELGEIPDDGTKPFIVKYENYIFTVESIKDRRIERVKMEIIKQPSPFSSYLIVCFKQTDGLV